MNSHIQSEQIMCTIEDYFKKFVKNNYLKFKIYLNNTIFNLIKSVMKDFNRVEA